ncbi:MAG: orotidine-5'-phosphate decarboxylase [Balneolales bacterium]
MKYIEKLNVSIRNSRSVLCAGLDPVPEHFPPEITNQYPSEGDQTITFCRRIIEQSKTGVAAYKINLAYFEALGSEAYDVLDDVLDAIPSGKIIIADAKRSDVSHTAARYKIAFFDRFGFDAITLSPFMGMETMVPFLQDEDHAVYALTLTSNPGAGDFMTRPFEGAPTLSMHVAGLLRELDRHHPGSAGMVIGATQSDLYGPVLKAYPKAPLLIPGIGAQGGSVAELQKHLAEHQGIPLINVSRSLSDYDPTSNDPWDVQIALHTGRLNKALQTISDRYLPDSSSFVNPSG